MKCHICNTDNSVRECKHYQKEIQIKMTEDNINNLLEFFKTNHKGDNPLDRNLMSKEEIKGAEILVKNGKLNKGTSTNDKRQKVYYY